MITRDAATRQTTPPSGPCQQSRPPLRESPKRQGPASNPIAQTPGWQRLLATAITDPAQLLEQLGLGDCKALLSTQAGDDFPMRVPQGFVARMRKGDIDDPLLRQVLPLRDEEALVAGYSADPLREQAALAAPGLLHKYQGRALLSVTPACAVHCRYCFRRHFPYREAGTGREHWQAAINYLREHGEIDEVLLSGGDPLSLGDNKLRELLAQLDTISTIKRIRLHTRLPVVLPERITPTLLDALAEHAQKRRIVIVIHANHGNEIDHTVEQALRALIAAGCTLLNQSVLLRGVNDSAPALIELSQRLIDSGTLPYYLHLLDPVAGAAHFNVDTQTARTLHRAMQAALPGYAVPRLSQEIPGEAHKTLIAV